MNPESGRKVPGQGHDEVPQLCTQEENIMVVAFDLEAVPPLRHIVTYGGLHAYLNLKM